MSARHDTEDTAKFRLKHTGLNWRSQVYTDTKSVNIIDAIVESKKQKILDNKKPKITIVNTSDEIKIGHDRELYFNPETHAVKPSGIGTRQYAKLRKQVLEEEGYRVD